MPRLTWPKLSPTASLELRRTRDASAGLPLLALDSPERMSSTRYEDLIDNAALNALSRSQLAACRAGEAIPADDGEPAGVLPSPARTALRKRALRPRGAWRWSWGA